MKQTILKISFVVVFVCIIGGLIRFSIDSSEKERGESVVADLSPLPEGGGNAGDRRAEDSFSGPGIVIPEEGARRIKEVISEMSEEDKRAKPEDVPMELWAHFVATHKQNVKQNGQVKFFGRVVDQEGVPLPRVEIHVQIDGYQPSIAEVMESETKSSFRTVPLQLISDETGFFEIKDMVGTQIVFELFSLDGYVVDENTKPEYTFVPDGVLSHFKGPRHEADPDNPVVITMRRKSE